LPLNKIFAIFMLPEITTSKDVLNSKNLLIVARDFEKLPEGLLSTHEYEFVKNKSKEKDPGVITLNRLGSYFFFLKAEDAKKRNNLTNEKYRQSGASLLAVLDEAKIEEISIWGRDLRGEHLLSVAEGLVLGNYKFLKYKSKAKEQKSSVKKIVIDSKYVDKKQVKNLNILCDAVYRCRDLVNEPFSALNAEKLAAEFEQLGKASGIKVEVFDKTKIESLNMSGLLAVNKGSVDPPTFTVMEWKPLKPVNKKPFVLVGKGIVFDTGGISLKPPASMEEMKGDMAGAAAAACALYAIAQMGMAIHVIALIPATDNRPQGNATVPGDVITMMNGTTVEILNTDAEGRLILADALCYAKDPDPELVIDLATLTGAASVAIGRFASVGMHKKARKYFDILTTSGMECNERIVEFPLWDEYGEMIKSEVADIKNTGGRAAGAITAGKFLEKFTSYPWIHLDIAGPAYIDKKDGYRTPGGTGVGVRLLVAFAKKIINAKD
jgi:leucyl aminopeptidase